MYEQSVIISQQLYEIWDDIHHIKKGFRNIREKKYQSSLISTKVCFDITKY